MKLENKVALITGGGSGIGQATAHLFAAEGALLALVDYHTDSVQATLKEIEANGGQGLALTADVSQADQMQAAVQQIIDTYGRVDIVFANAGINGLWAPIDEIEVEEWDQTMAINLRGVFLTLKYTVPHMREHGGSIIMTASIQGTRQFSVPGSTAYACTKAGLIAMTKKLALELAPARIRVNAVCPGGTKTNLGAATWRRNLEKIRPPVEYPQGTIPLTGGQSAMPEQIARLVLFLASDDADMISGAEVTIDGAQSLLMG
jgi:NAD(P)-dependent dehydrogenase (short-subunit alcohol dehydrogenase family)